jgi:CHAD domain-containing protein
MALLSVFSVLARAIEDQLEAARASAADPGPEGIHDLRVSTRRLRAAVDLWLDNAPGKKLARCRKSLRRLGRRLGAVREIDVNRRELSELALGRSANAVAIEFAAAFEARRKSRRARELEKELERIDLPDLFRQMRAELAKSPGSEAESISLIFVARRELERRVPPLEGLLEATLRRPSAPALHRFRIELKKLRYSVEMCGPAYDGRRRVRLVARLKELQDALGAAQDAQVLHDRFASLRARLRKDGLAAAERSLLPAMRAVAVMLHARQAAAVRELESCRRERFLTRFEASLRREPDGVRLPAGAAGRVMVGQDAASVRL